MAGNDSFLDVAVLGSGRVPSTGCDVGSWSQTSTLIRPRAVLSERARSGAVRRVGEDSVSVAAVARGLGVGWSTVMDAVREFGEPRVAEQLGFAFWCAVAGDG